MPEEINNSIKPNREEVNYNIEPSPRPPSEDPDLQKDGDHVGINCPTTTKESGGKKRLYESSSKMDRQLNEQEEGEGMTASSSDHLESTTKQESSMPYREGNESGSDWLLKVVENRIQDYRGSEPPASTSETNTADPLRMSSKEDNESESEDWLVKVVEKRILDYRGYDSHSQPPDSSSGTNTVAASSYSLRPLQTKDSGSEPQVSTSDETNSTAPPMQLLQRQERLQQRPGAYSGVPGVELQRMESLRHSLVGANNEESPPAEENVEDEEMANTTSSAVEPQESPAPTYGNGEPLLEAVLVEEEEERNKTMGLPLAEAKQVGLRDMLSHRKMQGLIGFLLLLLVAIVVVVAVVVTNNNQDNSPDNNQENNQENKTEVGPYPLLPNLPNFTAGALLVTDTPQSQAYSWLEKVSQVDQLDAWRRYQLYSLATIYYTLWDDNTGIEYREIIDPWLNSTSAEVKECLSEDMMTIINITCNAMNQVTGLALDGIKGTYNTSGILQALTREGIPPEISLLSSLETLAVQNIDTWNVQLRAILPARLKENENFTSLTIQNNSQVKGDLPSYIGQFQWLHTLHISGNALSSNQLPTELGLITTLSSLHYKQENRGASDVTIPSEFGNLVQLQQLSLPDNQFVDVPTEIGNLAELRTLDLGRNRLTFIPSELGRLLKLQEFRVPGNQIEDLPTEIGNIVQVQTIDLNWNRLWAIPSELGRLEKTELLILRSNSFNTTIPTEIGNLRNLGTLDLGDNGGLKGEIPQEFSQLSQLKVLNLDNAFSLNLTNFQVYGFESLEYLSMSSAGVSSFPAGISTLSHLKHLNLQINSLLSASIPTEIGLLSELEYLLLQQTSLTNSTIVSELGLLSELLSLDLSMTHMVGSIPTELGMLTKLSDLNLYQMSYLTGPIPSQLGQMTDLKFLHLAETGVTGTIPTELALLTDLRSLALFNADITGPVPEQICEEDAVEDFVVSLNCSDAECPKSCNTTCECVNCGLLCVAPHTAEQLPSCSFYCKYSHGEYILDTTPPPWALP